jgi:uncharacterized DUF497 family protein
MGRIIKLTAHAIERALHRGVDQTDIERIINSPTETIYNEYEENYKSYGLANDPYTKDDRYLVIFHTTLDKYVNVISVMWTDMEGLRRHGFRKL